MYWINLSNFGHLFNELTNHEEFNLVQPQISCALLHKSKWCSWIGTWYLVLAQAADKGKGVNYMQVAFHI